MVKIEVQTTKEFENHRKKITASETILPSSTKPNKNSSIYAVANAGPNQYINYPETTNCILNGSDSFALEGYQIIKWEWSKSELSPSIGVSYF